MSTVRVIDPCSEPRWDAFVAAHPFGWLCHLSGWKRAIEASFSHMRAHYFALYDDKEERLVAALPTFEVKSMVTGHRLVSLPFATLSDPLISATDQMEQLLDAALGLLEKVKASYMELKVHASSALIPTTRLAVARFYKNHYLRLGIPLQELQRTFHRSCVRQRIGRAGKSGLEIRTGDNESDLRTFYRLHAGTRKRLGLPATPFPLLKGLWDAFFPAGHLTLLLSEYQAKAVGGVIVLKFKDRMSAEFLGWDEGYRDMSPSHHLFWEAIKLADREGRRVFDFGRSSPVDTSLMTFKSRWGTSVIDLPQYYYPRGRASKGTEPATSVKYRMVREICRRAPDPAFRLIGAFCYRHMG